MKFENYSKNTGGEKNINFSWNWNGKLHTKNFTTIRLQNPAKYTVGGIYSISLYNQPMGKGTIIAIKDFHLVNLTETIARIDTGYSAEEAKKMIITMYKNAVINGKPIDWNTQLLSHILIYQEDKIIMPLEFADIHTENITLIEKPKQLTLIA